MNDQINIVWIVFEMQVACSHDNQHVVAVTSNNMVCIWRRTEEEVAGDS